MLLLVKLLLVVPTLWSGQARRPDPKGQDCDARSGCRESLVLLRFAA